MSITRPEILVVLRGIQDKLRAGYFNNGLLFDRDLEDLIKELKPRPLLRIDKSSGRLIVPKITISTSNDRHDREIRTIIAAKQAEMGSDYAAFVHWLLTMRKWLGTQAQAGHDFIAEHGLQTYEHWRGRNN